MNELKVFYMDLGWAGNIVVIEETEETEEAAREIMKREYNYSSDGCIQVLPIQKGVVVSNMGDS